MKTINLSDCRWELSGWTPVTWETGASIELGLNMAPEVGPVPAVVPGSIQKALLNAGIIQDWKVDLQSRSNEWIENRDWMYRLQIPKSDYQGSQSIHLELDGLDGNGVIYVNRRKIASFSNGYIPHAFDLTELKNTDGLDVEILFHPSPRWLGQFNYTSQIKDFKPRYNYTWDWLPRNVQIGIYGGARLVLDRFEHDLQIRSHDKQLVFSGMIPTAARASLRSSDGHLIKSAMLTVDEVASTLTWDDLKVDPWNPFELGTPVLYDLEVEFLSSSQTVVHRVSRKIGFKSIEWRACDGAPAAADPWICVVNGKPLFIKGVNWTPLSPYFADLTEEDYRQRISLYRDLGFNLFRVWGGAFLETEWFYKLCDEFGILVWQEFPLCSSGTDNTPPEDPSVIKTHLEVARSYISRRGHHVSLLCWCGGNELQTHPDGKSLGFGKPVDFSFPLITALAQVVSEMDPQRRFLPASSSGPRFQATMPEFGKGLHWDVHGPWTEESEEYWAADDSLFRSELGAPSASSVDVLKASIRQSSFFPISIKNPLWQRFPFWLPDPKDDSWKKYDEQKDLDGFIHWSQNRQSIALVRAVSACMNRFPKCGGVIIWMGHDCFPCLCNTAIIGFDGKPKPAALAIAELFKGKKQ